MFLPKKMKKVDFKNNISWIKDNQMSNGSIVWDDKGKCDPWDHLECLISLAIYEEHEPFHAGIEWFLQNLNDQFLIPPLFQNQQIVHDHFEFHHAPYLAVALLQYYYSTNNKKFLLDNLEVLRGITNKTLEARDKYGYFYWATDKRGLSDNSLITATSSIFLSLKCTSSIYKILGIRSLKLENEIAEIKKIFDLNSVRFNRDKIDRSRFSMDCYYPYLSGLLKDGNLVKSLQNFYVDGIGIKCVIEEPWVTFAESSEAIIALVRSDEKKFAEQIFNDIMKFRGDDEIFSTGYQFSENIYWPDERSTWTNAAVIIAADALYNITDKPKAILA